MNAALYDQFVVLKSRGNKTEAKSALNAFIASFATLQEKKEWTFAFLENADYGHKIRHETYENIIYPTLLDGYLKNEFNSIFWLAKTIDNLYEIRCPHPKLGNKTDLAIFKEAFKLDPTDDIRLHLLDTLLRWFSFSQHEWPAGILYGMDGADMTQCEDILNEVRFARTLDKEGKCNEYFSDFESKIRKYISRLQACNSSG
jgi:hypothetical protein